MANVNRPRFDLTEEEIIELSAAIKRASDEITRMGQDAAEFQARVRDRLQCPAQYASGDRCTRLRGHEGPHSPPGSATAPILSP